MIINTYFYFKATCIFLAVDLDKASIPKWVNWLLVTYVVIHAITHIVLSVRTIPLSLGLIPYCCLTIMIYPDADGTTLSKWWQSLIDRLCHARYVPPSTQRQPLLFAAEQE